jgi:hypothetical protein
LRGVRISRRTDTTWRIVVVEFATGRIVIDYAKGRVIAADRPYNAEYSSAYPRSVNFPLIP